MPSLASTPGMEYTCVRQAVVPNRQAYIHQESGDGGTDVVVPALQLLEWDAACCGPRTAIPHRVDSISNTQATQPAMLPSARLGSDGAETKATSASAALVVRIRPYHATDADTAMG